MLITKEKLAQRCEVCHQSDLFDAGQNNCLRCDTIALQYTKKLNAGSYSEEVPFLQFFGIAIVVLLSVVAILELLSQVFGEELVMRCFILLLFIFFVAILFLLYPRAYGHIDEKN